MRPTWSHPTCALLVLVNILAFASHVASAAMSLITPECVLDDDGTNPLIERCLRKGDRFVEKYLRHVRTNKQWQYFDTCTEFLEFGDCIAPMMEKCSSIQKAHHHWKVIYDAMKCVCNGTTMCQKDLQCFEQQYAGVLSRRCDAFYRFNVRQGTRDKCHFITENVRCKESLVTSACGASAGELAFHLFKLSSRKRVRKRRCVIPHHPVQEYTGFRYDSQCPDDGFPARMEECRNSFLSPEVNFHDDNELVAMGKRKEIKRACKAFKSYKRCTRPIKDSCRRGAKILYDYDGGLRTYLLKMDYICERGIKKDYLRYMTCYREVLSNDSLSRCDQTWEELQPKLNSITAQEFYCQTNSNATKTLRVMLDNLRKCYESTFIDGCGQEGGDVISGLMRRAFQDPYYLKFKYKPDCKLHRASYPTERRIFRPFTLPPVEGNSIRQADASVGTRPISRSTAALHQKLSWLPTVVAAILALVAGLR